MSLVLVLVYSPGLPKSQAAYGRYERGLGVALILDVPLDKALDVDGGPLHSNEVTNSAAAEPGLALRVPVIARKRSHLNLVGASCLALAFCC